MASTIRRRPWNRVDLPVYSICSRSEAGFNMNICTYATAISMKPKRFFIGLYYNTQTLSNVLRSGECILQLLDRRQASLVNLLGRKSGQEYDKITVLHKRKLITQWKRYPVLQDALSLLHLRTVNHLPCGDHEGFLFEVTAFINRNEGVPLTLEYLREKGLMR